MPQQVRAAVCRAKDGPVEIVIITVPDPGRGSRAARLLRRAARATTRCPHPGA